MFIESIVMKLKLLFMSENEVFYINGSETLPPPLTKDEELKNVLLSGKIQKK